jgi:hypothetical protein
MSFVLSGIASLVEIEPSERKTRDGYSSVRRFKGTHFNCGAAIPAVEAAGLLWNRSPIEGSPFSILEIYAPDLQDGTDPDEEFNVKTQWSFDADRLEKDLTAAVAYQLLAEVEKQALRDLLLNVKSETEVEGKFTSTEGVGLFDLWKAGTRSVLRTSIVLRALTTISPDNTYPYMVNVDKKFTKAQLIAQYPSIPASLQADMPAGDYLKIGPDKHQLPNGRVEVSQEFIHADAWSEFLYAAATLT